MRMTHMNDALPTTGTEALGVMRIKLTHFGFALCTAALITTGTHAAPLFITPGSYDLLPDRAGQVIEIPITGGAAAQGLNFRIMIGDGGVEVGGSDVGPMIEQVELATGTIWSGISNQPIRVEGVPMYAFYTITTQSGFAATAEGVLAKVVLDTSGLTAGSWALRLQDPGGMATNLPMHTTTVGDGLVRIVIPEPTGALMLLTLAGAVVIGRKRMG